METTNVTIDSTGYTQFDHPIKAEYISLNYINLYQVAYNIPTDAGHIDSKRNKITIPAGYYTQKELESKLEGNLQINPNTSKVTLKGGLTGGLSKLIEKEHIYITPLGYNIYVDGIDTTNNLYKGKRSSLLTSIPIGKAGFGSMLTYEPQNNIYKKLYSNDKIDGINIRITDLYDNDYKQRFIAEFTFK